MPEKVTSKKFTLNVSDFSKAILVAILGALVTGAVQVAENIKPILENGALPSQKDLIEIGQVALSAGVAYLVKNFFTPQQMVSVLKMIVVVVAITGFSSCKTYYAIKDRSSIEITRKPVSPNDTISIESKIWGMGDIAGQIFPPNSKARIAMQNGAKYCTLQFTQVPTKPNDTLAVKLTCHSLGNGVQKLIKK